MQQSPELVVPAGDFEKLQFAFAYGANAVYAGAPLYSLRARENSFTKEGLAEAIAYAHELGRKLYVTMNIYAHNSKIRGFLDLFCELHDLRPDAYIMTDAGLIRECLRLRPQAIIHLSTQANATNWTTVSFWQDVGVKRVILPRELSLKEIAEIRRRVPGMELEAFVHGSICIAYSGRCLISNYLTHRDANQGTCTNSCRWQYRLILEQGSLRGVEAAQSPHSEEQRAVFGDCHVIEAKRPADRFSLDEDEHGTYFMNSKDLCAVELLAELIEAGVSSFKIEGRTKSPFYLATTTKAYRRAVDDAAAGRPFDSRNLFELLSTASRTFTTGFYLRRPQEYGENFDDGDSLPLTHRFAGQVVDYDSASGTATVQVKNKISVGDELEWIAPGALEKRRLTEIRDKDGLAVDSVSGGCICRLAAPFPADCFTLLRRPLN